MELFSQGLFLDIIFVPNQHNKSAEGTLVVNSQIISPN